MKKRELTTFGVAVKMRLVQLGMTQNELAAQVGTTSKYLSNVLYGERSGAKYRASIISALKMEQVWEERPSA